MSNQAKAKKLTDSSLQQQEKLQAIILLDSYTNKFEPFSSSKAECLMPFVGGKTLLDNNIEYLIENEVEEIYLFCTRHHKQIKEHIDERKWRQRVEIHFLYNFKCQSLGDAMREIDAKGLVRSNFILITANSIVSNTKIKEHLELHKQTSKTDKNALMTIMCLNKSNDLTNNDQSFSDYPSTSLVLSQNNRILNYEQINYDSSSVSTSNNNKSHQNKAKTIKIPVDLIKKAYKSTSAATKQQQAVGNANAKLKYQLTSDSKINESINAGKGLQGASTDLIQHLKTVQQRNDLLETQIYLCSPYVLHIFTDNFDFDSMDDFIRGVLVDEEVVGYTIYVDTFKKKFSSHFSMINNLNTYYYETMRLLQRTDLLFDYKQGAEYSRVRDKINVLINKNSKKFGDNLKLERNVFIASNCKIGEKCELVNCYLADNCVLGNNVKIANSIILSNTIIGNNSVINASLIGSNVRIGNTCNIIENSLFSNECWIKDNTDMKVRGVFYKKDGTTNVATKNTAEFTVSEDNYIKYVSTTRLGVLNDDDEDEIELDDDEDFGMSREAGEDDDDDNRSVDSAVRNAAGDTSKNGHFFVWKLKNVSSKDASIGKKLLRPSDNDNSDVDMALDSSEYSTDSSADDLDDENEDLNDYDDLDEDDNEDQSRSKIHQHEDTDIFLNEVLDLLKRGLKENLDNDNVILEINSSKHANNIQIDDVCYYLTRAVLYLPIICNNNTNRLPENEAIIDFDYLTMIKSQLKKYTSLLQNYFIKSRQSQKMFLSSYLDFFIDTKFKLKLNNVITTFIDSYYVKLLHYLYQECDFLNEEEILEWSEKQEKAVGENVDLKKYANKKTGAIY